MSVQQKRQRESRFPASLFALYFVTLLLMSGIHIGLVTLINENPHWNTAVQILIPTAAIYSDSIRWWNEFFPAPPIVQMKVNNVETGIRMVEQKLGWMMVPELSLKNVDKTDRLFRMPVVYKDGSQLTRKTYILCRNSAKHLHTAAAFVDFLIDCGG